MTTITITLTIEVPNDAKVAVKSTTGPDKEQALAPAQEPIPAPEPAPSTVQEPEKPKAEATKPAPVVEKKKSSKKELEANYVRFRSAMESGRPIKDICEEFDLANYSRWEGSFTDFCEALRLFYTKCREKSALTTKIAVSLGAVTDFMDIGGAYNADDATSIQEFKRKFDDLTASLVLYVASESGLAWVPASEKKDA